MYNSVLSCAPHGERTGLYVRNHNCQTECVLNENSYYHYCSVCLQWEAVFCVCVCVFCMLFICSYTHICMLHALCVMKQFSQVWLQKPGLAQEHRFGSQSSKQFHTFLPD